MKISVIIPAFNEEKLIAQSLASIREAMTAFTEKGWAGELIVCDNNSTDRTSELARAAGATVVFEPFNQIGRARNKGAEAATGDWLIFVDADSHPSRGLFADAAKAIESGKFLFGGSTLKLQCNRLLTRAISAWSNQLSRATKYVAGCFIFCEAAAFRKVGGFDGQLFVCEEIILARKLKTLARASGKRAAILHRHPIVTSDRKLRLYSSGELIRFLFRVSFAPRKIITDRDACHAWYDGRR